MDNRSIRVEAKVHIPTPAVALSLHAKGKYAHLRSEEFARRKQEEIDLEDRPLKGRFAHIPYSSEDYIKEKREENERENRRWEEEGI